MNKEINTFTEVLTNNDEPILISHAYLCFY